MSQIMSMTMLIMNSFLFSLMIHPMNMGITLLLQTVMMCVMTGIMSQTSWFSYILFLVFLGGMLVLFIYMTSIASNELFMKNNYYFMIFGLIILMMMMMLMMDPLMMNNNNSEDTLSNMMMTNHENILTPLYNNPTSYITVFMVLYLFLTLLVIVLITKYNKGPLRPMN